MYFGSVKFFKHLITIIISLLVLVTIAAIVVLTVENNDLKKQIRELNNEFLYNDRKTPAGEQPSDTAEGEEPVQDETTPEFVPEESPYDGLFEDLYAENYGNTSEIEYSDDSNYIYLTFDDGPSNNTLTILKYLRNHNAKATFFVVPNGGNAHLLNQIAEEGHAIGVHSYSHKYDEVYESVETYLEDFYLARNLIHEQTGLYVDIYRFPGGSINDYNEAIRDEIITEMNRRGFVYFDWNVDSRDSSGASWDTMYRTVRADVADNTETGERSVVLFHDSASSTFTTWVIEDLLESFGVNPYEYIIGKLDLSVRPLQW
ncbi:MAG: polysaccharide deacetylase [Oscillospiraceae bacterium]|nr:polysaccharide deacetylase [Oscillospiraceae bacterium]